jgi:hypothetical protein
MGALRCAALRESEVEAGEIPIGYEEDCGLDPEREDPIGRPDERKAGGGRIYDPAGALLHTCGNSLRGLEREGGAAQRERELAEWKIPFEYDFVLEEVN